MKESAFTSALLTLARNAEGLNAEFTAFDVDDDDVGEEKSAAPGVGSAVIAPRENELEPEPDPDLEEDESNGECECE